MLLLYRFKLDVFDRAYQRQFITDYALIARNFERRSELVRRHVEREHNYVLRRCVLIAARPLSSRESFRIRQARPPGENGNVLWLAAARTQSTLVLPGLYLYTADELATLQQRSRKRFEIFLLSSNRCVPSLSVPTWKLSA